MSSNFFHSISSSLRLPQHHLLPPTSIIPLLHPPTKHRPQSTLPSPPNTSCHSFYLPAHLPRSHLSSRPTLSLSPLPPPRIPSLLSLLRGMQTQTQPQIRPLAFGESDDRHPLEPQPSCSTRPPSHPEIFGNPSELALPLASRAPTTTTSQPLDRPAPPPPPASVPRSPLQPDLSQLKPASKLSASTSRLSRPAKQVITLTPKAIEHLARLLEGPTPKLIRVGVKNKGCAGMAYHLEYVDQPGKFDEIVVAHSEGGREVHVMIDSRALFSIIGSEMDWEESKLGNKFVFNNPNIKEQCGCGESFLV